MVESNRLKINTRDLRVCRFYFIYIQRELPATKSLLFDTGNPDTETSVRIINGVLETYIPSPEARAIFINRMELSLSTTILPEKLFSWLCDDKRAAYWFWGSLSLDTDFNRSINKAIGLDSYQSWYKLSGLSESPSNHNERYNIILALLDYICTYSQNTPAMRKWLEEKKIYWKNHVVFLVRFKWLTPEDIEVCRWAYSYIQNFQKENAPDNSSSLDPVQIPAPLNVEEMFHAVYGLIDLWKDGKGIQSQLITKMKKAHYQKKFRKKLAAKRGREEISEVHKERLESLARFYRTDKASVLEMLIDERTKGLEVMLSRRR
ncbi:MAG: hypothetical protein ACRDB3_11615 [Citrobacter telavivensis]